MELNSVYSKLESKILDGFIRLKKWNSAYNIVIYYYLQNLSRLINSTLPQTIKQSKMNI